MCASLHGNAAAMCQRIVDRTRRFRREPRDRADRIESGHGSRITDFHVCTQRRFSAAATSPRGSGDGAIIRKSSCHRITGPCPLSSYTSDTTRSIYARGEKKHIFAGLLIRENTLTRLIGLPLQNSLHNANERNYR